MYRKVDISRTYRAKSLSSKEIDDLNKNNYNYVYCGNTTVVKYRKRPISDQSSTELQQLQLYGNQDLRLEKRFISLKGKIGNDNDHGYQPIVYPRQYNSDSYRSQ